MNGLLPRPLFSPEHETFRAQVRRFVEKEIVPHHAQWEQEHVVPRALWQRAGANGLLCGWLPEDDGGPGGDLLFDVVVSEELNRVGATGPGFGLHSLIVAPYIAHHGRPDLKRRVLPPACCPCAQAPAADEHTPTPTRARPTTMIPPTADHPRTLQLPAVTLFDNLAVSARRYPEHPAIRYYGRSLAYAQLLAEAEALAGYLQQRCGVQRGDRVVLYLQNCPQFVVAYHAVLRADAVVVPVNAMNLGEELAYIVEDAGARVAIAGGELQDRLLPLLQRNLLDTAVTVAYGDYCDRAADLPLPDMVRAPPPATGCVRWRDALDAGCRPGPAAAGPDDLAALPYTSGTTGQPKGCMHTHRSLMATAAAAGVVNGQTAADVMLAVTPFFHITGMQMVMNNAVFLGATLVVMTRWDREAALRLIREERVTSWINIPTMVIDLLASPDADAASLASLRHIGGGGAAMPEAVAARLKQLLGLDYIEGYGLTETAAPTHSNPPPHAKRQCLGRPICNTDSLIVDPDSGAVVPAGQVGEIVVRGPQVFAGYWQQPAATQAAFADIDGRRWFRTGDLGRVDGDGYFFLVDRLKRMINAAGYKVWPAEVEALLFGHPAVQEGMLSMNWEPTKI